MTRLKPSANPTSSRLKPPRKIRVRVDRKNRTIFDVRQTRWQGVARVTVIGGVDYVGILKVF